MTDWPPKNLLCYGDNLAFLKDFDDECVDLIYLDPPFNSQQSYNVLFKEATGTPAAAQIKAFEDTWRWDMAANVAYTEIGTDRSMPTPLVELMRTLMNFLRPSPMMAYLVQMAVRLVQMHRVLKPTGSLYLHCDPTASHYLKVILDAIFGPRSFRNEVVWKRTTAHSDAKQGRKGFGCLTDVIFYFTKSDDFVFNPQYGPYDERYLKKYGHVDSNGRHYRLDNLTGPGGAAKGNPEYEVMGVKRHWRYSKKKMERLIGEGRVVQTRPGSVPQYKRYLDEMPGRPVQNLWDDISPINSQAQERLGYPTQKPLELLKRIVAASSNPRDVVLDPFCGCGTTIDAVETLNREHPDQPPRRWIGIDITHLAINLIKHRLTRFDPAPEFDVVGEPASTSGARALAQQDPFQFQFWALGLVGARPLGGKPRKGADRGIDGVRYFQDEQRKGALVTKPMLVQVKSGKVKSGDVRDFVGTLTREKAEMGVFITLEKPTAAMKKEAASAEMYLSPWDNHHYPRVQLLTVEELLADPHRPNPGCLQVPGGAGGPSVTLPRAQKHRRKGTRQEALDFEGTKGKPKKRRGK